MVGQGDLLLRREAGNEPRRQPRHGDEQQHDQPGDAGRDHQHRKPAERQRLEPEAGQRHAVPQQEGKQPHDDGEQNEELDLEQEDRADKKDCRRQPGRRQPCFVRLAFELPGQRQHADKKRDEEIGAPHRHGQRRHGDEKHDQDQLDIPALPAAGQHRHGKPGGPEQHQSGADLHGKQADQRCLPQRCHGRARPARQVGSESVKPGPAHREPFPPTAA